MEAQPQHNPAAATTTVDPYKHLELVLNSDGSLSRNSKLFPDIPATPIPDPDHHTSVLSKDITFNQLTHTWFRIYLPTSNLDPHHPKLPVIFYYHGGGFILCSAATSVFHVFCCNIAASLPAIVISVDYRLAPEHRLPAAYDDAVDALHWIKTNWAHADWLRDHADFSSCYLMGTSAGANMAYHVGLRLTTTIHDLEPLKIRGLVLHEPFFGGTDRTRSELRLVSDLMLRPGVTDMMWELSLPVGSDRDHEYCNIKVGVGPKMVEKIKELGWKVLVTGFDGDPLYDHVVGAVDFLRGKELEVAVDFTEGGFHAADVFDPSLTKPLHALLKKFMSN